MSWLKLDDKLTFHAKIVRAKNSAVGAWVRMAAWCAERVSDGVIPPDVVALIASPEELSKLLEVGLLHARTDGSYEIHDYLKYNPSREIVLAARERWSKNQKNHRRSEPVIASVIDDKPMTHASVTDDSSMTPGTGSGSDLRSGSESSDLPDRSALTPAEQARVRVITQRPPAPTAVAAPPPAPAPESADVLAVLEHWAAKLYPGRRPLFDDKRRKRVKARLREGFSVEDLKKAIDGALKDDFLMGLRDGSPKGGYRDVSTVLRDAAQVERLRELAPGSRSLAPGRPRNDFDGPGQEPSTLVRKLAPDTPRGPELTLEEHRERAASLAGLTRMIGGGTK